MGDQFDWKRFQKHLGFSDEELQTFKSDPRRARSAERLFSREVRKKDLIIEVVHSHGCTPGLKAGDRLVFAALGVMDKARSSDRFCAHALGSIPVFAAMAQDRYAAGLDPGEMIYNHFPCIDVGPRCGGWGQVIMKAYVADNPHFV